MIKSSAMLCLHTYVQREILCIRFICAWSSKLCLAPLEHDRIIFLIEFIVRRGKIYTSPDTLCSSITLNTLKWNKKKELIQDIKVFVLQIEKKMHIQSNVTPLMKRGNVFLCIDIFLKRNDIAPPIVYPLYI